MTRLLLLILFILPTILHAKKPNNSIKIELKHSKFSIVKKKKKIVLSCKPIKSRDAGNANWVSECNNAAYNLLTQEYYQGILKDKEVQENPFGDLSYQAARETGASFMKKKSIRKSFKIHYN